MSTRAITIHGIKIRPAWNWTKDYRRYVTEELGRNDFLTHNEQCERMAEKYARWMAERDSIDLSGANRAVCYWHYGNGRQLAHGWNGQPQFASKKVAVQSVEFRKQGRDSWWGNRWHEDYDVVARINVPWSASQPAAIELEEDQVPA